MTSILLDRVLSLETVGVEIFSSFDGQGSPSYASPQNIQARTKKESDVARAADGSDVLTTMTVWVPGGTTPVPTEQSRLTIDGQTFIVVNTEEIKRINDELVYTKLMCRDEAA